MVAIVYLLRDICVLGIDGALVVIIYMCNYWVSGIL